MADVFVGFFYDTEKESDLLSISKVGVSAAANQYQKGFLSGLPGEVEILTTLSTGVYPRRNKRLIFREETKAYQQGKVTYLPFVNLYFIRDWMFKRGLYRRLTKIIRGQAHTTVYVYSLNTVFERVMVNIKRKFGEKVSYCLIVPDLPGTYGIVRKGIKGIKDRLDAKPKMELAGVADRYVFLTEAMAELFPPKPHTVIEGFLPAESFNYENKRIPKTILYTGTLGAKFGMQTLLDAFGMIADQEYQLWICGSGSMVEQVRQATAADPRIQYKGFLPKSEIAQLQTQCDILVNPRPNEGAYTKFSFPSKTMEYLLSGSKVVMHRLPGIGEEYYRYIRVIPDTQPATLAKTLMEACNDTEFYQCCWGEQVQWIRDNKTAVSQVQKLLALSGQRDQ